MNMRFPVPPEGETHSLANFRRPVSVQPFDRARLLGLAFTGLLHVAAIAGIVYGGIQVAHSVAPPPIMVSLDEIKPDHPRVPPPPPPLVQPHYETAPTPEIIIASDAPPPIHTEVTPTPPVKADPPPSSAAPAETQQSYLARLLGYLNRYKRYPAEARSAHVQGVVMIHFVMDRSGHVTLSEIATSSGKPLLDAEALALMQRAQPLPAIPADFGKDTINAIVPIEFSLR